MLEKLVGGIFRTPQDGGDRPGDLCDAGGIEAETRAAEKAPEGSPGP